MILGIILSKAKNPLKSAVILRSIATKNLHKDGVILSAAKDPPVMRSHTGFFASLRMTSLTCYRVVGAIINRPCGIDS